MILSSLARPLVAGLVVAFQSAPQIPAPRGLVNDFAGVLSAESAARMERISGNVRSLTGGEIAVVTLADIGVRAPSEIALRIGREWKVGKLAGIGDRARNAGVVILLVPKETSSDGKGHCRVETGQGSEGFITDATSAEICREATPSFAARDYSAGLELVTLRVAQRFAQEFNVSLDSSIVPPEPPQARHAQRDESGGINPVVLFIIVMIVLSLLNRRGGRRGCIPIFLPFGGFGGGGGGGWSSGGGGGGGFGGFGGGGGFSGGGGGSDW